MRNCHYPQPVRLLQINDSKRKSFGFPTAGSELGGFAKVVIGLDVQQCNIHSGEKRISEG